MPITSSLKFSAPRAIKRPFSRSYILTPLSPLKIFLNNLLSPFSFLISNLSSSSWVFFPLLSLFFQWEVQGWSYPKIRPSPSIRQFLRHNNFSVVQCVESLLLENNTTKGNVKSHCSRFKASYLSHFRPQRLECLRSYFGTWCECIFLSPIHLYKIINKK